MGPTLRSYDAACEELGGEPWRTLPETTDRWFLPERPKSFAGHVEVLAPPPLPPLETGAFDLRPHWSSATRCVLGGGTALVAIVLVVIALPGRPTRALPTTAVAPTVTAPPVVRSPVVTAPLLAAPAAAAASLSAKPGARAPIGKPALAKLHVAHRPRR